MKKTVILALAAGCLILTTLACSFTRNLVEKILPEEGEEGSDEAAVEETSTPAEEEVVEAQTEEAEEVLELLNYSETPFTFFNATALETYVQGDYDPDSGIQLDAPSFEELRYYVESGWLVTFELTAGADLYDQWVDTPLFGKCVVEALNAEPAEEEGYYLGLRNVDTGEGLALLVNDDGFCDPEPHPYIAWMAYTPDEPFCYPTTDFAAINLGTPPFDQLEVRQAFAAATDQEAYQDEWGWGESEAATNFVPQNSWGVGWGDDYYFRTNGDDWEYDLGGWLDMAYCGECRDNDLMMTYLAENWREHLGIEVELAGLSNADFYAPLAEGNFGVLLKAVYGSSWYDFVKSAVDAGWVMIPDSEYDAYMQLVHDAAMEPDRAKQGEMIVALDRLLVEEYVSVIPLITYETCVAFYQTWEEVNP